VVKTSKRKPWRLVARGLVYHKFRTYANMHIDSVLGYYASPSGAMMALALGKASSVLGVWDGLRISLQHWNGTEWAEVTTP
jgi:hypothetical protein